MLNLSYNTVNNNKEATVIINKESINGLEARKFTEDVVNKIEKDAKLLIIDFSEVAFVSSAGLGMLVNAHLVLKRHNIPIKITGVSEEIRKLFAMTKIDSVIEIT
jgi:anti-sigma B factor antagonist